MDINNIIQMAIAVARFLEHFFPNLSESKILTEYTQPGDSYWWDMVKSTMVEYRVLREEARAEAESEIRQQLSIGV